ncbi:AbrB/MazE/SpoVT family DNA-binding domain-containing protein [Inquilinus limosus]|uniref:antitoxin n=1 Tax=Inquilinus limosus TaxID=171674 RepID=UPI003F1506D8
MRTRLFRSGNSLAVRIPKELAFADTARDVEIERRGDSLIIRPAAARSLARVAEVFASFPPGFMAEGREQREQKERDWDSS